MTACTNKATGWAVTKRETEIEEGDDSAIDPATAAAGAKAGETNAAEDQLIGVQPSEVWNAMETIVVDKAIDTEKAAAATCCGSEDRRSQL